MTRILLAEDNVMIAMMAEADLRRAGYDVLGPFLRNEPALAAAEQVGVELAFVDVDLKDGDSGIELARLLKVRHDVPSVFMTGQADQAQAARELALGLLTKPFRSNALVDTAEAALDYVRRGEPPAETGCLWF